MMMRKRMHRFAPVAAPLVLVLFVVFAATVAHCSDPRSDVEALIAFKNLVQRDPNNALRSWDPTLVDACTWFHITCDGNRRVTRVDLQRQGIVGSLAPELGDLDALQYLELEENFLSGSLPPELAKLHSLVSLDLFDNLLTGPIPQEFDHFEFPHNLKFLRLKNNKLTGGLFASLGLIDLKSLDVSGNQLSGFLPTTFSRYPISSFRPGNAGLCGGAPINKAC